MFYPPHAKTSPLDDLAKGVSTVLGYAATGAAAGYAGGGLDGARAAAIAGAAAGVAQAAKDSDSFLAKLGAASAAVCIAVLASKLGGGGGDSQHSVG
jgi:hypothetical protein